ncbi:capsular polysaccharide transport system permease protein [Rhizobium sp. NFR07]|uniref:ABC transporter permease n=1 Tax=Rhizobium sp. NFR07 TaxID=1566262 RepID=UPI0008E6A0E1|nr:ABC transporter permease [Rhizobium sp. NFR07]SFB05343.1 capsular polysaccharide transport system permease protein [Rhizobium sp. NFR07]
MNYLQTHSRVVSALLIREMSTRFGSKPGGYLWALLDPISHVAFLSVIFMAIAHTPPLGTSFPLFFATGYIGFQFYQASAGYLNTAVTSNRSLLTYPNVAPIDTVSARHLLQLITTIMVGVCILWPLVATMRIQTSINYLHLMEAAIVGSTIALGAGLANNVLFIKYPLYEKIFGILSRPLFLISGIFYLPDALPPLARDAILFNPLAHIVMRFRMGFYPQYRAMGYDGEYVWTVALVMLFIGILMFTMFRRALRAR